MFVTNAMQFVVVQPMSNTAEVPWHHGSVTSSPSRRYPVGLNAASAPMYDVSTLRRKSLDRRRKLIITRSVCSVCASSADVDLNFEINSFCH